jgi:hypothetical protein
MRNDRLMPTTSDNNQGVTETVAGQRSKGGAVSAPTPSGVVRGTAVARAETAPSRNGVPILTARKDGVRVTLEIVERLSDEN